MNNGIHYLWKNNLVHLQQSTSSGENITVIDRGTEQSDSNIFHGAKVKIGDKIWAGDIVLHKKSSDWESELHEKRGKYDNVILHVTMQNNCDTVRRHGEIVEQLEISCPASLEKEMEEAFDKQSNRLPCATAIANLENIKLHSILSRLLIERIEEKAENINRLFKSCDERWEETLFKTIIRSFGFGVQSSTFEELATTLNFQALGKHRDNIIQVEAIFFGQAGLLEDESTPYYYRENAMRNTYYNELKREYRFLANKFKLKNMDYKSWGSSGSTPHVRIARLASLYYNSTVSISGISACNTLSELYEMLDVPLHGYWYNHTCFGGTETCGNGRIKQRHCDIIIINAIVPILYVYGKQRSNPALCEKAEDYLHDLKREENSITRRWEENGVTVSCAADSQALIQLNKRYCSANNCINCKFAYHYIKSRLN